MARAGESARRQGQPSGRSRLHRRHPDRPGQQRVAAASHGNTPGAGPDVRHRLPALGSVQRRPDRAGHCSRHAPRRTARRRRAAGESSAPLGRHVRRRLHEVRTIAANGVLRPRRRLPEGRPHPLSAEYGVGRRAGRLPVHTRAERRHRFRLRRRAHRSGQRR